MFSNLFIHMICRQSIVIKRELVRISCMYEIRWNLIFTLWTMNCDTYYYKTSTCSSICALTFLVEAITMRKMSKLLHQPFEVWAMTIELLLLLVSLIWLVLEPLVVQCVDVDCRIRYSLIDGPLVCYRWPLHARPDIWHQLYYNPRIRHVKRYKYVSNGC